MRASYFYSNKNFLKILLLFAFAFLVPRFFPLYAPVNPETEGDGFKFGLDNMSLNLTRYLKYANDGLAFNVALFSSKMSVGKSGKRSSSVLLKNGVYLKYIFSNDSKAIRYIQSTTQIPIKDFSNEQDNLDSVDIFIIDLQNSGLCDQYVEFLYEILKQAFLKNKKVIVLDRPNPLGFICEGPIINYGIPFRHGLTVGEISKYLDAYYFDNRLDLQVVPMAYYIRTNKITDLFEYQDDNLKKAHSYGVKALCKLLGKLDPLYVGLGSSKPNQCIMLSKKLTLDEKKWQELKSLLSARFAIDAFYCSYYDKVENTYYTGLLLEIDNQDFSIINSFYTIINFLKNNNIEFKPADLNGFFNSIVLDKNPKEKLNKINKIKLLKFMQKCKPILLYDSGQVPVLIN